MKTVIIYRSFFSTTKRYAELLHEEIESDIYKHRKIKKESLVKEVVKIISHSTEIDKKQMYIKEFIKEILIRHAWLTSKCEWCPG